ncbi:hypothetical protein ABT369_39635 [Dactylosporangium sp. NPDC000244]|uniref:hypothetical protein n=1 Tax=Dactylosporangium sp. NPDC000244 TaxID=3154365 RepID=UPI0033195719
MSGDEFYEFSGDAEFGKPPYWVRRVGLQVYSQIDGKDPKVFDCDTLEHARARFAQETRDPEVGAPMPGDVIQVVYGDAEGEEFTVESTVARGGEYGVTGNRSGRPLRLRFGQYRIVSRPAA